ncbi:DNA polymerase III alpha subunit [Rhizobium tibeticum]|nr:DNA polymerase III alpha subunit [Rhizobium tibeticum]
MLGHFFVQMFVIAIVLGSAANAAVSYSPGITNDLPFERLVWQERDEVPVSTSIASTRRREGVIL